MESGSGFELRYKLVYGNEMSFQNWQGIVSLHRKNSG